MSSTGTNFTEGYEGMYPPIFLEGTDNFEIKEFDRSTGGLITDSEEQQFTDKVAFKDGDSELRDSETHEKIISRYTFDPYSGTVYLGIAPRHDRRVVLAAQKIELTIIPPKLWEYDRHVVTNRINTQKILLDPRAVYTIKQKTDFTYSGNVVNGMRLISGNEKEHNWFNKRLIKGSVTPSASLFPEGAKPIEVPFIDGRQELTNIIKVNKEPIEFTSAGTNLWSFTLNQLSSLFPNNVLIGAPAFGAVRSELSTQSSESIFNIDGQISASSTPSTDGQWVVDKVSDDTVVTVWLDSTPESHVVSYSYQNTDPGIDTQGLYSIDYDVGTIYFSESPTGNGTVSYEVSAYSAFYNLAKVVSDTNIQEVIEKEKSIIFDTAFGLQFTKQKTASKSRPQVLKVIYDYYNTSTESLADLEPYFSPICKDIAFKAVTSDTLEEL
jgi:hypothetical protein